MTYWHKKTIVTGKDLPGTVTNHFVNRKVITIIGTDNIMTDDVFNASNMFPIWSKFRTRAKKF